VKKFRLLFLLIIVGLVAVSGLVFATPTLAETLDANQMFGGDGNTFANTAGLASGSLVLMIARAIRIFLGFLGVIAVIIVLYAGFLWTTAGGEEDKLKKAKKILKNGVIGLLIILSSFAIAQFVLSNLTGSMSSGTGIEDDSGTDGGDIPDYAHTFVLRSVNTDCASSLQNLELRFVFSQKVSVEDVTGGGIAITKGGEDVLGEFEAIGGSGTSATSFTFTPEATCSPYGGGTVHCFEAETTYNITVGSSLESSSGYDIQCSTDYPCEFTFTTGTGFDLAAPTTFEITAPENRGRVSVNDSVLLQTEAVDDTGVSSVDYYIDGEFEQTSTDDNDDTYFDGEWDTTGYITNESYEISAEGADCAGNDVAAEINVTLNAANCYNETVDTELGETELNCGGDSTGEYYCGTCNGDECSEESPGECASGSCIDGICVEDVEIESISPGDGAPGNLITISGQGFGTTPGSVVFLGSTTEVSHSAYSSTECVETWSDSQVIIQLKDNAESGPIKLVTAEGEFDRTDDDNGAHISDFEVNDTVRPGLCAIDPETGEGGDSVTLFGINLGESSTDATLYFDSYDAAAYSDWSESLFGAVAPALNDGNFDVQLFTGAGDAREGSNQLNFTVASVTPDEPPTISQIDPESGPVGQYITIYGSNFGTSGTVRFNSGLDEALGDTDFPDECEDGFWSDDEIIIKVPSEYLSGSEVEIDTHDLYISSGGLESEPVDFEITTGEASPGLCAITPDSGPVGSDVVSKTEVVLYGQGFGTSVGSITFNSGQLATIESGDWSDRAVGATAGVIVPDNTTSGPVFITDSDGQESNSVNFTVGSCDVDFSCGEGETCCDNGTCSTTDCTETTPVSHYAYYFSTGNIPDAPSIIVECGSIISPTPWDGWEGGTDVCSDAALSVRFTEDMDVLSYSTTGFLVEKCTDETCNSATPETMASSPNSSSTEEGFDWVPAALTGWIANTWYHVTVYGGDDEDGTKIISQDGLPMAEDVDWKFKTSVDGEACAIGGVIVTPDEKTSNTQGEEITFGAQPISEEYQCTVLNCTPYTWNFTSSDPGKASVGAVSGCGTIVTAEEETSSPVAINAYPSGYTVNDDGYLTISFTDPEITDYWPNCSEACMDALIGVTFNISMDDTFAGSESGGSPMVRLYSCGDPGCAPDELTAITSITPTLSDDALTLSIIPSSILTPDTSYRVVISGEAESLSGSLLSEAAGDMTWYGDLSWVFTTKSETCLVDRVEIDPPQATAVYVGAIQRFTAIPYGAPDACSAEGQRLIASNYEWDQWVAIDEDDETSTVVDLVSSGDILISSELADGCNSNCLHIGTEAPVAVCGDGDIGPGEDCDGGEDCSESCLHKGSSSSYIIPSACGDGLVGTGEECDDSNTANGDGCSSICLNEGASVLDYDCNDGRVAHSNQIGGEECNSSEEGCSSNCLHEGSESITDFYGVCGNGGSPEAGEDCDDGNTVDSDGCSSRCLHEGSSSSYTTSSTCGDGSIGTGEDCDDRNIVDSDGCSSHCLSEGSGDNYGSICGDTYKETGEECEATGIPESAYFTIAQITDDAPQAVLDSGDNSVSAFINATEFQSQAEGSAEYILECSCLTDYNCDTNGDAYGCGDANCCFERPEIVATDGYYPEEGATNVCRNTAIWMKFTDQVEIDGLEDSGTLILEYIANAAEESIDASNCPSAYTTVMLANETGGSIFARAWDWVATNVLRIFGVNAETYKACVVPVTYTQTVSGKVELDINNALEPGDYELIAVGETDTNPFTGVVGNPLDGVVDGVAGTSGVGIYEGTTVNFTVGTEICAVEMVSVEDTGKTVLADIFDESSPYLFTESGEEHTLEAAAYTLDGASAEEIQTVAEYSWTWSWGDETGESVIEVDGTQTTDTTTATTDDPAINGSELASATATVTDSSVSPAVTSTVTGSAELEANMCETLWPDSATATFPYLENYSNFSFYYCRDQASGVDLPELEEIEPVVAPSGVDIKEEILFLVDGTSDAIGVRVFANEEYLSPADWFVTQGFSGSPSETTVDGYEAVQEGNTYYVAAANYSTAGAGTNYPNIYVISYNEGASAETELVVKQILENWKFNAGTDSLGDLIVSDNNICAIGSSYQENSEGDYISCESDSDCINELGNVLAYCDAEKAKLRRNLARLIDAREIATAITDYGEQNRHCSVTKGQECEEDADCPGDDEVCVAEVPEIQSGTFLSSLTTSTWPSWSAELGNALGVALPTDPLNSFYCPDYTDQTYCWNSTTGTFSCDEGSYAYLYQSFGGEDYVLSVQLEEDHKADYWAYPIDDSSTDNATIYAEFANDTVPSTGFSEESYFCDGSDLGISAICGDGIQGLDETCELGDTESIDCAVDGTIDVPCLSDCSGYMDETQAKAAGGSCIPFECGNGVVDGVDEDCDDGANNGEYGYCGSSCKLSTAWYCGDGYLAGGEECDCYSTTNWLSNYPADLPVASWAGINDCEAANGQYNDNPSGSCSFDCSYPGPSCGDGEINGSESCDGNSEVWSGALCGATDNFSICTTDTDCPESGVCGDVYAACPVSEVCVGGSFEGQRCPTAGCGSDGECSDYEYQLSRSRTCDDGVTGTCGWNSWSLCLGGDQTCGNGEVEGEEECDDGNDDETDDCTNECTLNVCGDDAVYAGHETCDNGSENGTVCSPDYSGTCNYCNVNCQYTTVSGSYCGDNEAQTGEFCDGTDLPKYCYKADSDPNERGVVSTSPCESNTDCDTASGYSCLEQVGVCNGGSRRETTCASGICLQTGSYYDFNGQPCVGGVSSSSYDCGTDSSGGTCMVADCGATCSATCPFTYSTTSVSIQTELVGATEESSADLYSFDTSYSPNAASIFLPACSLGNSLTADINIDGITQQSVDIIFVTDLSGSMGSGTGSSIEAAVNSITSAIGELFDAFAEYSNLQIGLVSFTNTLADGSDSDGDGTIELSDACTTNSTGTTGLSWFDNELTTSEAQLIYGDYGVESYLTRTGGSTPLAAGLKCAAEQLDAANADEQIIIILSDGQPNVPISSSYTNADGYSTEIQGIRDAAIADNIQIYTAALTTSDSLIGNMAHWSSDTCLESSPSDTDYDLVTDCSTTDDIQYAYSASTSAELDAMYQQIIDSIIGLQMTFTTDFAGTTTLTTGNVFDGDDMAIPFPEGFQCNESDEWNIPFRITFKGEGTVNISDIKLSYCPAGSASTGTSTSSTVDSDSDGVYDFNDNCPTIANADQTDVDSNEIGDVCEEAVVAAEAAAAAAEAEAAAEAVDGDRDDVLDTDDICPSDYDPDQEDSDSDGVGDVCDNCPTDGSSSTQQDTDLDGVGNVCDNCWHDSNSDQINSDEDDLGDACDNCPLDGSSTDQTDTDGDDIGDLCDSGCGDGIVDSGEYCDGADPMVYCYHIGEADPALRDVYSCGTTTLADCTCDSGYYRAMGGAIGVCTGGSYGSFSYAGSFCISTARTASSGACGDDSSGGLCALTTCDSECTGSTLDPYLAVNCGNGTLDVHESCDATASPSFESIYCVKEAENPAERDIELATGCTSVRTCICSFGYSAKAASDLGICDGGTRRKSLFTTYNFTDRLCVVGSTSSSLYCGVTSSLWGTTAGNCTANTCGSTCASSSIIDMFFAP